MYFIVASWLQCLLGKETNSSSLGINDKRFTEKIQQWRSREGKWSEYLMRSPKGTEQCNCEISFLNFQLYSNTMILIILNFSSSLESVSHPLLPDSLSALNSAVFRAEFSHLRYKTVFFREALSGIAPIK